MNIRYKCLAPERDSEAFQPRIGSSIEAHSGQSAAGNPLAGATGMCRMGTLPNREAELRSGKKSPRVQVHDLPALGAALQFEAHLALAAGGAASLGRLVFHLELGQDDAAMVLLRDLQNAEGDEEAFIAVEIGCNLILEAQVSIHFGGVKGGEQSALGVTFEAVTDGAEDFGGGALVECGAGRKVLRLLLRVRRLTCLRGVGILRRGAGARRRAGRRGLLLRRERQDEGEKHDGNDGQSAPDHVAIS